MRILEFDQFEFPYASSEERLRLFIENKSRIAEQAHFLATCLGTEDRSRFNANASPMPYGDTLWKSEIYELISHFVPQLAQTLSRSYITTLLHETDEHSLLIETGEQFVLYEWSSAA
jgi:hypothetical protein